MSKIFMPITSSRYQACLKIINDEGKELSLAFDDSCGFMKNLGRVSMAHFNQIEREGDEVFHVTPEEFLEALAKHLGRRVVSK